MTPNNYLQEAIFREITKKFPSQRAASEAIAKILSIGKEAVYRRMRRDTMLIPNELLNLCRHFNISMDKYIFDHSNKIIFHYHPFVQPIKSFDHYINQLLENLNLAVQIPDAHIYCATQEITPFQYFFSPELIAFKLYVYGLTVWELDFLQGEKCSLFFGLLPTHFCF